MKPHSLLLLLWVITIHVQGQSLIPATASVYPGGIRAPFQWYVTDSAVKGARLNFHPAMIVEGGIRPGSGAAVQLALGTRDLHEATYFTVYQSLDTARESVIWHLTGGQKASLVLTTSRMADLPARRYMNFIDKVRGQPKVNIYVQHKEKDSLPVAEQSWYIGVKPVTPNLPVSAFKGAIPEIIAYDRVLNSRERLQVVSYLALKYGITLTEPGATYLNSAGETIWSGYDYPDWHHNVAGIGRDDSAGLDQPMAGSSNAPGLMTMAALTPPANRSFLLWGDNGKALTPAPKVAGMPMLLQKTWLVKPYGGVFATSMIFDTKAVDAPLPVDPVYWVVIDRSGQGKFAALSAEFVRMDQLDVVGKASFGSLQWDKDGSGKDVWGLVVAKDLLLATAINQPTCALPRSGSLRTRVVGGMAPYQLAVQGSNGFRDNRTVTDNGSPVEFGGLSFGKYFLVVTDARGRTYTDSLYLNDADAPLPRALASSYTLPPGRPLELDASIDMPDGLTWQWTGPGGFESFSPEIQVTTPGLYSVTCSKDGCSTEQDITVSPTHNNLLYNVTVYPNPSPGLFTARVTLDDAASVTMSTYTQEGRLVAIEKGEGRSNYYFSEVLATAGVYEVVFVSGLSSATKRIIIVK